MITPIQSITSVDPSGQGRSVQNESQQGLFAEVFQSAIDNVRQTEMETAEQEYLLATGQLDNPATLLIAQTRSAMAVDLLVQLRNRALDAYSELSRISM